MTAREVVRTIPVPTSVSDHAQQFLGAGFGMADGAPSPAVDDLDGWRSLIEVSLRTAASAGWPIVPHEKHRASALPLMVL